MVFISRLNKTRKYRSQHRPFLIALHVKNSTAHVWTSCSLDCFFFFFFLTARMPLHNEATKRERKKKTSSQCYVYKMKLEEYRWCLINWRMSKCPQNKCFRNIIKQKTERRTTTRHIIPLGCTQYFPWSTLHYSHYIPVPSSQNYTSLIFLSSVFCTECLEEVARNTDVNFSSMYNVVLCACDQTDTS